MQEWIRMVGNAKDPGCKAEVYLETQQRENAKRTKKFNTHAFALFYCYVLLSKTIKFYIQGSI